MSTTILTIRVPKELDKQVSALSKKLGLNRSDIVRIALQKFSDEFQEDNGVRPYEKVKSLVGSVQSRIADLGSDHRKHLLHRIRRA